MPSLFDTCKHGNAKMTSATVPSTAISVKGVR